MKNSCRTLLTNRSTGSDPFALALKPMYGPVDPVKFRTKRRFHASRSTLAMCDPPNTGPAIRPQAELGRNPAVEAFHQTISIEVGACHLLSYSDHKTVYAPKSDAPAVSCQGENVPTSSYVQNENLATHIKAVRENVLKLSQAAFATRIGVSQSNVSRWEKDALKPETEHLIRLANLLQGRIEGIYFLEAAGIPIQFLMSDARVTGDDGNVSKPGDPWKKIDFGEPRDQVAIPLLRDAAAAGTPRAIDDREIEAMLYLPKAWIPRGAKLVAVRVAGDSMSPNVCDADIVVVDLTQTDAKRLNGRMVAARNDEGVTVKWLHRSGTVSMLVPQNTARYPIYMMDESAGWQVVGAVVHWICFPPKRK